MKGERQYSLQSLCRLFGYSRQALLIADSSNVLLSKGYGYADKENKIKNTANTRFSLSSGSKIFTGTATTYLAQQGKLKFTDTI